MPPRSPALPRFRPRQGLWFPLALAFLLVLLLPGFVLLLLSLFGLENQVNGWLQSEFGLGYRNRLPVWAAIVLLLMPLLLVLLYFLKLRRRAIEVPSTFLWRKTIEDLHVNSLFQWLRDNVLLLVQLGIVLLLVYSSLEVQLHGSTATPGRHYILIVDSSASMSATDLGKSRLELAKEAALNEIDARPDGDIGMVIEFNSRASLLQTYTGDKAALRAAVRSIEQTQRPTRVNDALTLADGLANPTRSGDDIGMQPANQDPAAKRTYVPTEGIAADIHLFSDGRFPDVEDFAAGNLTINYHRMGEAGPKAVDNIGIVALNAVRDEKDPTKLQVFLRVANYRPAKVSVTVELEWQQRGQEGFSLLDKQVSLDARVVDTDPEKKTQIRDTTDERGVTFDLTDVDESSEVIIRARLKGVRDRFPLDDEAWLVTGIARKAQVLIASPGNKDNVLGNKVLNAFFGQEATKKVAHITAIDPGDLLDPKKYIQDGRAGKFDLCIFDRCAPDKVENLPRGNTFFIDNVPPPWKREDMPPMKTTYIRNPTSNHSLMRHLRGLDEIAFSEAFEFDLTEKAVPGVPPRVPKLLETGKETAVLFVLPRGTFQDVVLAFPLVNKKGEWATSWNLKESLPLFFSNLLYQLGNVSDAAAEENTPPGELKSLRADQSAKRLEVECPDKRLREARRGAEAGNEYLFSHTEQIGIYRATWSGGSRSFAVNLLDPEESNIQPRDDIKIGEQVIEAGRQRPAVYDTWKWIAFAAVAMLLIEWAMYHRRSWF